MTLISVVVPCYNQGEFIQETLTSIGDQNYDDYEVVIVDDGSTDPKTKNILGSLNGGNTSVIRTTNQGLAAARNNGIREANGEFILPLDADDRIGPTYLEKAIAVFEAKPDVGIVYCKAETFGEVQGAWNIPEYSLEKMLLDNIIFCSAMFRKKDWEKVGGYDTDMTYGWEDYDFWLSLIERGVDVYRIPEVLFFYRVMESSMVRSKTIDQKVEMFVRVYHKHHKLFDENIDVWLHKILRYPDLENLLIRSAAALEGIGQHARQLEGELEHLKQSSEWHLAWRLARMFWKIKRCLPFINQATSGHES